MALFGQSGRGLLPPVVKVLLIANISIYILQHFILAGISSDAYAYFVGYLALWPVDFTFQSMMGFSPATFLPHQLITYQFMHGSFWHLFFNMFMLWMFGTTLERVWGSRRFFTIYLLSGFGAAFLHLVILHSTGDLGHPTVGASGSLYGILIGFAMMFPNERLIVFPIFIPIKAKYVIIGAMVIEMFSGVTGSSSGVAHFAHIGGAITAYFLIKYFLDAGFIKWLDAIWPMRKELSGEFQTPGSAGGHSSGFGFGSGPKKDKSKVYNYNWFTGQNKEKEEERSFSSKSREPRKSYVINGEEITQDKIDEILDKINESGYRSLDERERKILTELSKKL